MSESTEVMIISNETIEINNLVVNSCQNFLVIDDEPHLRESIASFIEMFGFTGHIHQASCLREAKKILSYEKVDYIISDWNLPDGRGISLLKAIRKSKRFSDIPFLMVTADDSVSSMILASQYGGSDYLVKPFTLEQFKNKIADGWKTHVIPTLEEVQTLKQKILDLKEENELLRDKLKKIQEIL